MLASLSKWSQAAAVEIAAPSTGLVRLHPRWYFCVFHMKWLVFGFCLFQYLHPLCTSEGLSMHVSMQQRSHPTSTNGKGGWWTISLSCLVHNLRILSLQQTWIDLSRPCSRSVWESNKKIVGQKASECSKQSACSTLKSIWKLFLPRLELVAAVDDHADFPQRKQRFVFRRLLKRTDTF